MKSLPTVLWQTPPGRAIDEDGYPIPEDPSAVIDFSAAEFSGAIEEEYIPR